MALTTTPPGELGSRAPDFRLRSTAEEWVTLESFKNKKALLVAFICNHCPYVQAIRERLVQLYQEFAPQGLGMVGVNSNDTVKYPEDSFVNMKKEVELHGYRFPYVLDETQSVARAYGAVCTPDFFLYSPENQNWSLTYRGRLDDSWKDPSQVKSKELAGAIREVLSGKKPGADQKPSMGCSIKWKSS